MLLPASLRWVTSLGFWGLSTVVIYQFTMYCQEVNTFPGGSPIQCGSATLCGSPTPR